MHFRAAPTANPPPCNPTNTCSADGGLPGSFGDDLLAPRPSSHFHNDVAEIWPEIKQDYRNYYSWENFGMLVAGFSVGAAFANTNIDQTLRNEYQDHVRSSGSDQFAPWAKEFGTGGVMLPAMAAGWLAGEALYEWPVGEAIGDWGDRSLRSAAVGAAPMLFMQYATGASRPGETSAESHWKPFTDSNGVSGHAFIGGLVFINAAKETENPWLKAGFYACSALPGWSRINDDAHYPSQVLLGWWMAYCAATAVDETDRHQSDWKVVPLPTDNGAGMALMYQY